MKKTISFLLLCSILLGLVIIPEGQAKKISKPIKVIEDFSDYHVEKFPRRFRTYPFQRSKASRIYKVAEEKDNFYLKAVDGENLSTIIFREFLWDVDTYPYISWRWRARILPKRADERNGLTNDSACGVYVNFGKYQGEVLKYTWSTLAPAGTVYIKKPDKMNIIVKESGTDHLRQWQTVTLHIPNEYARHFKKPLDKRPSGIGVLTDGNATGTPAACDYDDFMISQKSIGS
jgi:hypothetical protein